MIRLRVYVAGPYSHGDIAENVSRAMSLGHALMDAGFTPYVPHLSHFMHLQRQRPYEDWTRHDLEWLAQCDVLVRLPGKSPGADTEVEVALERGLPVVIRAKREGAMNWVVGTTAQVESQFRELQARGEPVRRVVEKWWDGIVEEWWSVIPTDGEITSHPAHKGPQNE